LAEPERPRGTGGEVMWQDLSGFWINELVHADPDLDLCHIDELMQRKFFLHQREISLLSSLHLPYLNVTEISKVDRH
jgi:hypothetical protein